MTTTDQDTPPQPCPHDPDGMHHVGCGCDFDFDDMAPADDEAIPAGEQLDRTIEAMLTNTHRSAELLLTAKRAQRAELNAEIRTLVAAEDKARRALSVYRKAAAK